MESKEFKIVPFSNENNIPLVLITSNAYTPYCGTLIQSIVTHSNRSMNYDIIILNQGDISQENESKLSLFSSENISVRLFDCHSYLDRFNHMKAFGHLSTISTLKLLLLSPLFSMYSKIVSTDVDLVFERDIADLYQIQIQDVYMCACEDVIMKNFCYNNRFVHEHVFEQPILVKDYLCNYLGLKQERNYLNTGVMILNLKKCREDKKFEEILQQVGEKRYWFLEQCMFNDVFGLKTKKLDMHWNTVISEGDFKNIQKTFSEKEFEEYENALANPYVVHFAGKNKPWNSINISYADRFYKYARLTPWYESIIWRLVELRARKAENNSGAKKKVKRSSVFAKIFSSISFLVFPKTSRRREFMKCLFYRKGIKKWFHYTRSEIRPFFLLIRSLVPFSFSNRNRKEIKKLKNMYAGKRCFVVGLGPSLTIEDLNCLKDEYTFALNNVFPIFQFTEWRPTFYLFQEMMLLQGKKEFNKFCYNITNQKFNISFFPYCKYTNIIRKINKNTVFLPIEENWSNYVHDNRYLNFSKDCSKVVHAAFTSMYTIVQLIAYMGFSEIYFIGTDCSYSSGKRHCYKDEDDSKMNDRRNQQDTVSVSTGFECIKQFALECYPDLKIYNATRGGELETFERIDFDDLFRENLLSKENIS